MKSTTLFTIVMCLLVEIISFEAGRRFERNRAQKPEPRVHLTTK